MQINAVLGQLWLDSRVLIVESSQLLHIDLELNKEAVVEQYPCSPL